MESSEYKLMYEVEERHWWFKGLRDLVFSSIKAYHKGIRPINILDVGCGTGINLKYYSELGMPYGVDVSKEALKYCRSRGLMNTVNASAAMIPFKDNSFDLAVSTDVICCIDTDHDYKVFSEINRVLKPGGIFIFTVPAHDYLRRLQDDNAHVKHRYSLEEIKEKVVKSGLTPIKVSYRNAFSYPVLLISKFVIRNEKLTKLGEVWPPLNSILYSFLKIENIVLNKFNLPFGCSVFCVAKK